MLTMPDQPIGRVLFTDASLHDVYRDQNGRQYVENDAGEPVYGIWVYPAEDDADVPIIRGPRA
jgi:hypothetical protein